MKRKDTANRDHELDDLLSPLRNLDPSRKELQSWTKAVGELETPSRFKFFQSLKIFQIASALSIGFVIGAVSFHHSGIEEKNEASATIEEVFTKSE